MNLMMILALLSTFMFAGPPPQRTPDNDLVADLVAATNDCLRDSIAPATPDDERVWTWSCIQLAFRINSLSSDQISQPGGSDVITAAIKTSYAAATAINAAGLPSTGQDALDLLDTSDSLLESYMAVNPGDGFEGFAGRPRDNAMAKSALAATADCLKSTTLTWQTMMGPGAEYSIATCDQLIETMGQLLAEPGRVDTLSPELREAATTLQTALELRDDLSDPKIAGEVLLLAARARVQLNIWE